MERLHITQWNNLSKDSRLEALRSLERKLLEKMELTHEKLQDFIQKVQVEFQKQYPDVQLKPFYLSTSKTAILL